MMIDPAKVPQQALNEMAGVALADAWISMDEVIAKSGLPPMSAMIFARLLTALVNTAQAHGIEYEQILGELGGFRE